MTEGSSLSTTEPRILHCPHCKLHNGQEMTLGSLTSDGNFIIRKQFGKEVMIASETYTIFCDCGYRLRIDSGTIITRAVPIYQV